MSKLRVHFCSNGQRVYVGRVKVPQVQKVTVDRDGSIVVFFPSPAFEPALKEQIERGISMVKQCADRVTIGHIQTTGTAIQPAAE